MTRFSIINSLILTGLLGLAFACSKDEPAASVVPIIGFKSIKKVTLDPTANKAKRDSVIVTISFSDGDGDLGEDPRDSTRRKTIFANQLWGNYQIRAFRLVNNAFEEIIQSPTPKLFVDLGRNSSAILPQLGVLDYSQLFTYASSAKRLPVKFQIRMRDRSLHESNVVETDTISLPVSP
jgi:hypothetical protein